MDSYNKTQKISKKNKTKRLIISLFTWLLLLNTIFSQDSIYTPTNIDNQKNIKFQEAFFKAITYKATMKYRQAIENLEQCNNIYPNNIAVLFELSKNYFKINRFIEAAIYAEQALDLMPNNIWIAEHLVLVYKSYKAFNKAIEVQKKIIQKYPEKKHNLVSLYLHSNYIDSANIVLNQLKSSKLLTPKFRQLKNRLNKKKNSKKTNKIKAKNKTDTSLETEFKKTKSYNTLAKLLVKLDAGLDEKLLKYSKQGLDLFPAQPLVYLMNAKAYNRSRNYKKALTSLQNGIDFIVDNPNMETNFYKQFIVSYKGLKDFKNVNKYQKKIKK
ncbi:MAG: tetratricopeptide repeat protein [Tenacibaculum sp.]